MRVFLGPPSLHSKVPVSRQTPKNPMVLGGPTDLQDEEQRAGVRQLNTHDAVDDAAPVRAEHPIIPTPKPCYAPGTSRMKSSAQVPMSSTYVTPLTMLRPSAPGAP